VIGVDRTSAIVTSNRNISRIGGRHLSVSNHGGDVLTASVRAMTGRIYRVATVAAAAALLAACTSTGASTTTPSAARSGDSALGGAPTSAPTSAPTAGPSKTDAPAILADGRSPVLLKNIDTAGRAITFDLVELYLGYDAAKQWLKDHPGETEAPPLNGVYMVNSNPKLRTLPVAPDVVVKVVADGDPSTPDVMAFESLPAYVATGVNLFWITVKNGTVTLIEQQFRS